MKTETLLATFAMALLAHPSISSAFETLPKNPPVPSDNSITKEKIELGKQLFFDPRLSKSGTISCNSCHNVMAGGDDSRPVSVGIDGKKGGRSSPTVWNSAFHSVQFWDGRAPSLEEQAKGPIANPIEMGATHELVVYRISKIDGYVQSFKKVFGGEKSVSIENVAKAIATYERTLITPNAPLDLFLRGKKSALSSLQKAGMEKFQSVGCVSCHSGANFSGPSMPAGQGFYMKFPTFPGTDFEKKYKLTDDKGRFEATKSEADKGLWRVPTLRNVALTAPYFHNGSVKMLDEAVRVMAKTQLNKELSEQDVKELVAFLNALTGQFPTQTMPRLPDSPGSSVTASE